MIVYKDFEPVNRQFVVSIRKFKKSDKMTFSGIRFSMSNRKSIEWVLDSDEEVDAVYDAAIAEFTPLVISYTGGQ